MATISRTVVSVTSDIQDIIPMLDDLQRNRLPFAIKDAIDETTKWVGDEMLERVRRDFDRPSKFSTQKKAIFRRRASMRTWNTRGFMTGQAAFKAIQESYLWIHYPGGRKKPRGGRRGRAKSRRLWIPRSKHKGGRVKLNQYGNVDQRWLNTHRRSNKSRGIHVGSIKGDTREGVWLLPRKGNTVQAPTLLLGFHHQARYKRGRLRMDILVHRIKQHFPYLLRKALNRSMLRYMQKRHIKIGMRRI